MRKGIPYNPPAQPCNDDDFLAEEAAAIAVGSRCEVSPGDKRGEVK